MIGFYVYIMILIYLNSTVLYVYEANVQKKIKNAEEMLYRN